MTVENASSSPAPDRERKWTGVDLDGTLAMYEHKDIWDGSIAGPVPAMVERVKTWLKAGVDVRILTARVAVYEFTDGEPGLRGVAEQRALIEAWCLEHLGQVLPITAQKDYGMEVLYDDRCVQIERNTGELTVHAAIKRHIEFYGELKA